MLVENRVNGFAAHIGNLFRSPGTLGEPQNRIGRRDGFIDQASEVVS